MDQNAEIMKGILEEIKSMKAGPTLSEKPEVPASLDEKMYEINRRMESIIGNQQRFETKLDHIYEMLKRILNPQGQVYRG